MSKWCLSIIVLVCMLVPSAVCLAQTKNPDDWDIMGAKIGVASSQAKAALKANIPKATIYENNSKVATFRRNTGVGTFRLPAIFGAVAIIKGVPDKVYISYDPLDPDHKVVAIKREVNYRTNAPSKKSVEEALVEKYGKFDLIKNRNIDTEYYWFPAISNKLEQMNIVNPKHGQSSPCSDYGIEWVGARGGLFGDVINYGSYGWTGKEVKPICGKYLKVSARATQNTDLVYSMTILMVDTVAVRKAYDTIGKLVKEGEAAEIAKENSAGDKVKPKF